ncbi:MAG TPA: PorP/SprF family type IX secretion system membrane protein [Bacteroidia bacterium]|jgi:type IX secretion system PorP/SprF family membrane protein
MKRSYSHIKIFYSALFAITLVFSSVAVRAQDFHLSQYDAPPLFLNPALTGMFDGKYRVHAHYRTQWAAVATKPFTTTGISFDMPIKKFGAGLQVMNYRAGAGNFNALSVLLSAGYDVVFDKAKNHHLALGVQGGMVHKSVNINKLTFGNQYTYAENGSFDANIPTGETFSNTSIVMHDINAGFLYYYAKENVRLNPFIGFSAFHLTQPKESFYNTSNRLPIRYYVHGGLKINVNEKIQLLPKGIYMQEVNATEYTATLLLHYYLKDDTYLIFGPTYRSKDAGIIEAGIKKGQYTCRVSYDINTSSLKEVSNYRGGFEISFTYIARRSKPNPLANCPRL